MKRLLLLSLAGLFLGTVAPRTVPAADTPPARDTAAATTDDALPPCVYLGQGLSSGLWDGENVSLGQLRRELVRQAVLLAAREELGWQTRDAWLADRAPAGKNAFAFDAVLISGPPNQLEILTGVEPKQRLCFVMNLPDDTQRNYIKLLELCEVLSRETFPKLLKDYSEADAVARPARGTTLPVKGAVRLLDSMSFVDQFTVVRAVHMRIAAKGESEELLGALVRAYANLGWMTEGQWNPSHKVYFARSLLYAQRMRVQEPESAFACRHLAYALAAVGLHPAAMEMLEKADQLDAATPEGKRKAKPAWVPIIQAYLNFDAAGLKLESDAPHAQLAALLLFFSHVQSNAQDRAIRHALTVVEWMPECYRMHDDIYTMGGVSLGHHVTTASPAIFTGSLYARIGRLPGLPTEAREIATKAAQERDVLDQLDAGELAARRRLIECLYAAESTEETAADVRKVEPGWGPFALWVDDASFLQVLRRADFLRSKLSVGTNEYVEAVAPLIGGHRYHAVIEVYHTANRSPHPLRQILLHGMDRRALTFAMMIMSIDPHLGGQVFDAFRRNMDETANDLSDMWRTSDVHWHVQMIDRMLAVCPRSPWATAVMLEHRWEQYKDRVAEFDAAARQHACIANALGRKFFAEKDFDRAVDYLESAIKSEPSYDNYMQLANAYLAKKDIRRFRETLDTYLENEPDFGLDHARAAQSIAWTYIREHDYDGALPYAERAGSTGAQWALNTLAVVYEGLGRFEDAGDIYEAIVDRYGPNNAIRWFLFCRRTGLGNTLKARLMLRGFVEQQLQRPAGPTMMVVGQVLLLDDKEDKALPVYQKQFEASNDPAYGLITAMLADRLGQTELRDRTLAQIAEKGKTFVDPNTKGPRQNLIELAAMFTEDLAKGGKAQLDLKAADAICKSQPDSTMVMGAVFLGDYLAQHGKLEEAKRYWLLAIGEPMPMEFHYEYASYRLQKNGLKPADRADLRKQLKLPARWSEE